MAMLLTAEVWE